MQTLRSYRRLSALALISVVGIAGISIASPNDHAQPGHGAAPSVPKVAPKQLAPADKHTPERPAADPHAVPSKSAAPAPLTPKPAPAKPATEHIGVVPTAPDAEPTGTLTADQAIALLTEGNQRWVTDKERNPNSTPQRREQTASGQTPFATVLTCADSRLPVERIFDRGVGDVFVIRVAGNVAGQSETGTIEYGVGHLNTPVLIVMGHTKCGAVAAAASGKPIHGALGGLVDHIRPAVDRARNSNPSASADQLTAAAIRENVWQSIYDLYSTSPELRAFATSGSVKVVGAIYDIHSGQVEWIGEHPWQRQIIAALSTKTANPTVAVESHTRTPATPKQTHADASEGH